MNIKSNIGGNQLAKKKYYDEHGNQTRSKPPKRIYQKWWVWLMVVVVVSVGIAVLGREENIEKPVSTGISKTEKEEKETNVADPEEEGTSEELTYTYEDFKGTYALFEGEPYNSPIGLDIRVIGDDSYRSFNLWDVGMASSILDKTIEGNILTLHSGSETEQFELRYEGDKKIMHSIKNGQSLYSMSSQDLQTHYNQFEIDYARIILTINGEPSLDQWLVWEDPVVNINHSSAGDPVLQIADDIVYPDDVTHLSSTIMDSNYISYTANGDGYITIYPNPSHTQAEQSEEENRQLAQEILDNAYTIYVEPFDPYTVADFIGRVEFIYE